MLTRFLFETNKVDPNRGFIVMREACKIIADKLSKDISSAEIATIAHRKTYEILDCKDPYESMKNLAMSVGLNLQSKAEKLIAQNSETELERLRAAVLISIVGNVLDFGLIGGLSSPDDLIRDFDKIYAEGLGYDDVDKLISYLKPGIKILYLADNCGEIVFDKLLITELKKYGVSIILVVKGEPILSDATLKEAEQIKMSEVVDDVITTGGYAVGLPLKGKGLPEDLEKYLDECDLIISKGMGNFEALTEMDYTPILYLLRTKCNPVANAIGLPKNLNVAKLFE
jgi:uncharacterized protein with ATP-grasp and redox domains